MRTSAPHPGTASGDSAPGAGTAAAQCAMHAQSAPAKLRCAAMDRRKPRRSAAAGQALTAAASSWKADVSQNVPKPHPSSCSAPSAPATPAASARRLAPLSLAPQTAAGRSTRAPPCCLEARPDRQKLPPRGTHTARSVTRQRQKVLSIVLTHSAQGHEVARGVSIVRCTQKPQASFTAQGQPSQPCGGAAPAPYAASPPPKPPPSPPPRPPSAVPLNVGSAARLP